MEIKNKYYVYCHTCKGRPFYVGFGSKVKGINDYSRALDLKKRNRYWIEFYNNCEDFEAVLYEESDNKQNMSRLERSLVMEFGRKLIQEDGLLTNIIPGGYQVGGRTSRSKKIAQYSLHGDLIKVFDNVSEAAREMSCSNVSIYNSCEERSRSSKGYMWRFWNKEQKIKPYVSAKEKITYCYDRNFNLISTYNSVGVASRNLNIDRSSIINTCLGNRKSAGGYIWSYAPIEKTVGLKVD